MGGKGRKMGGRIKREGIYVYLCLIHVEAWQKATKFWKAIILQLKNKFKKSKKKKKKKYWHGLPCPSPGYLPDTGIELGSPSLQADSLLSEPPGNWNDVSIVSLWLLHPVPKITFIIPSGRGRPPLFPVSISRISVLQSFWLKTTVSSLIPPFLHSPHNQLQTNCIT